MFFDYKKLLQDSEIGLPKYQVIARSLRHEIISGNLPLGYRLPPEKEIAGMMGISHLTLRKALKMLSDQNLLVQRQHCGTYVSYSMKRSLRLALFLEAPSRLEDDPWVLRVIAAAVQARHHEFEGEQVIVNALNYGKDDIKKSLNQINCDGVIVHSRRLAELFCDPDFTGLPMVFFDSDPGKIAVGKYQVRVKDGVIGDAVDYLYELGHRDIGFISISTRGFLKRNSDFKSRTVFHHIEKNCHAVILDRDFSSHYDFARETVKQLCMEKNRPTAFILPAISLSYGAWQGITELGLSIPEDVSMIGFGVDASANPNYTTIVQPMAAMAEKAVELLYRQQQHSLKNDVFIHDFPADIIIRKSCGNRSI